MVGLFGLSSKGSPARAVRSIESATPPPPYSQDNGIPKIYATEMSTTTTTHVVTTTTQTTTHSFSLPLWRRRGTPAYSPRVTPAQSTDELGVTNSRSGSSSTLSMLHTRDKDLPPTPGALAPPSDHWSQHHGDDTMRIAGTSPASEASIISAASSRASSLQPASRSSFNTGDPGTSQPTIILARAALGLGMPHAAPSSVSASASSSKLNVVPVLPPPSPSVANAQRPVLSVRHAKSFHREPDTYSGDPSRRRTRGLSLGPLHLMSSDVRDRQQDAGPSDTKPLHRKSSFWSRKRVNSRPEPPSTATSSQHQPILPLPPPVSPFNINTPVPSPGLSAPDQSLDLQRRHSERAHKEASRMDEKRPFDESFEAPSTSIHTHRRRGSQRPQTADSTGSSPRLSYFSESRPVIASPTSSPLLTPSERSAPHLPTQPDRCARAQTNPPPLLHRLSMNLFGPSFSNTQSPTSTSAPDPPDAQSVMSPPSSVGSSRPSLSRASTEIPRPKSDEESPEVYLQRLVEAVSKTEVAPVLSSSADAFHARALRAYMGRFDFVGDPLDVAVRKLLMDVGLPRETQQIDRVIEAFAARYLQCNPNLFASNDHPYILAFSLIMLHTDTFNKSNKRKMTKLDYVKNTRLPGVAPEVLGCFYDNIIFAPFIFIEDPLDVNGQRGLVPDVTSRRMSTLHASSPVGLNGSGATLLGKNTKIDPYYLITRNLLNDLRVDVHALAPAESPYFYQGTAGHWDEDELQRAFALAAAVEIAVAGLDSRYIASPWYSLTVSGGPGPMFQSSLAPLPPITPVSGGVWNIKVTKIGLLLRKDDALEGGRRATNRKWREWRVLLSGSQILFFRDTTWAASIRPHGNHTNGPLFLPHATLSQPDEMFSVKDTIAVWDKSYTKYPNTFRYVMSDGRHLLLQAQDEKEMNEWIARINYASAFKTAGVRMRSLGLSSRDIELTGMAAAASHLKDIKHNLSQAPSPLIHTWNERLSEDDVSLGTTEPEPTLSSEGSRPTHNSVGSIVSNGPTTPPYENSSRLFKATFDEVKTELAAGKWRSLDEMSVRSIRKRAYSLESTLGSPASRPGGQSKSPLSSRPEIVRSKVDDLEAKISLARTQLDTDMRYVRNLAVLTPFQRATRDRLQAAVQTVAKRVMQVRLDLEKLVCHRDVLVADLTAEERDWHRTKHLAMRAATQKLASTRDAEREAQEKRERESHAHRPPKLTLSAYVEQTDTSPSSASSPVTIPRTIASQHLRGHDSSVAESFHSAKSGGSVVWEARHRSATVTFGSPRTADSTSPSPIEPRTPGSDISSPVELHRPVPLAPQSSLDSTLSTSDSTFESTTGTSDGGTHEKFYTAPEMLEEQAEEWNKTRAAKRVSLVKLPSDLRMTMLLGKHGLEETSTLEVVEDQSGTPTSGTSPTLGLGPVTRL